MVAGVGVGYGVFLVLPAPGVFHQKYDIHVNVFKFVLQRSTPNSFHMFASTPWNLWSSSLVSNSILHSTLLCVALLMYVTYYCFVISRIRFVLLQFFIVYCSSTQPVPHLLSSYVSSLSLYPTQGASHPEAAVCLNTLGFRFVVSHSTRNNCLLLVSMQSSGHTTQR